MSSTIIKINPSDIIADSMDKINYNFEVLSENENQVDYKLSKLSQTFNEKLETITTTTTNKHIELNNYIETLENKIDSVSTMEDVDIQGMVTDAIQHADSLLEDIISRVAGEQVESALGSYAKTSTVDEHIENYVNSMGFDVLFADANKKMATASRIVSNSTFYTEYDENTNESYLVYKDSTRSDYKDLKDFYESLDSAKKAQIDGDTTEENPLDDPDVVARLVAEAEKTFKLVSTELSAIMQSVSDGMSSLDIITAVNDPVKGKQIAAGIFLQANQSGSNITLNADNVAIESQNFKVNNGNVEMSGKITATSGTIGGITISDNSLSTSNGNFSLTSAGKLVAKDAEITGKIVADQLIVNDQSFLNGLSIEELSFTHEDEQYPSGDVESVIIKPTSSIMGDFDQSAPVNISAYHEGKIALKINTGVVQGFAERLRWVDISPAPEKIIEYGDRDAVLTKDDYDFIGESGIYVQISMHTLTPGYYYQNIFIYNNLNENVTRLLIALPPISYFHDNEIVRIYNMSSSTNIFVIGGGIDNDNSSTYHGLMGVENIVPIQYNKNSSYHHRGATAWGWRARSLINSKEIIFTPNKDSSQSEPYWLMFSVNNNE